MMFRILSRFLFGTLRGRLILGVAAVHAVMMSLFIADLTVRQRAMLLDRQVEEATALSHALATSSAGWIAADDLSGLQEIVEAQRPYPEILFVILADEERRVLADTDKSRRGLYLLDLPGDARPTVLSRTPALVDVAAPAMIRGHHVGWVRVGIGQKVAGEKLAAIVRNGVAYGLAAILIGSIIAWFMGRRITRRLYTVQETIDAVRCGNRLARSSIAGADEAAVMAREFNSMLNALDERDSDLRASEQKYRSLIYKVQTAIVLHDGQGRVLIENPLALELLGLSEDQLLGRSLAAPEWHFLRENGSILPVDEYPVSLVLSTRQPLRDYVVGISRPNRRDAVWALVNAEPDYDDAGEISLVVVSFVDISKRKRAEEALYRLNRELRAISNCNQILMRSTDEQTLLNDICHVVCDEAGYRMAWVGYPENDGAKTVRPGAWAGTEDGYLASACISWADTERGCGPTGTAIRSGQSVCVQDFTTDPNAAPWREEALKRGYRSSIAMPLKDEDGAVFCTFMIYSTEPNAFTPDEIRLLEELADDLAFGITVLRGRIERKRAEEIHALADALIDSLPGVFYLYDSDLKLRRWNRNHETSMGYTAAELAEKHVADWHVEEEDRRAAVEAVRAVLSTGINLTAFESTLLHKDGRMVPYLLTGARVSSAEGPMMVGMGLDISPLKEAEAAIRKSEARLNEAQHIAKIGNWELDIVDDVLTWSDEIFRMFEIDPATFGASYGAFLDAIHPDDRESVNSAYTNSLKTQAPYAIDHRLRFADGRIKYVHEQCETFYDSDGKPLRSVGTVQDITERRLAENERRTHLKFLESLDRVNRAIQGTNDLEQMTRDVLRAVLAIFDCDRAWLFYPCDPDAPSFRVPMEVAKPEYPGAGVMNVDVPLPPDMAGDLRLTLESANPATFIEGTERPINKVSAEQFGVRSMMMFALYPKSGSPWVFGLHQCSYPRGWTKEEQRLFEEIGRRLADALSSMLAYRDLYESEFKLAEAERVAHIGYWDRDFETGVVHLSDEALRIFGVDTIDEPWHEHWIDVIHPDDREKMARLSETLADLLQDRSPYETEYRVVWPDGDVRYVHSHAEVTRDAAGRPKRMFGTIQDITGRKQAEKELEESRLLFQGVIEQSPIPMVIAKPTGELTFNQACADHLRVYDEPTFRQGISLYEMKQPWKDYDVNGNPVSATDLPLAKALEGKTTRGLESRVVRKDGSERWEIVNAAPIYNKEGELIAGFVAFPDITDLKEAERKLTLLDFALNHVREAAFLVTEDAVFQYVNEEACRVLGYAHDEMMRLTVADLDHDFPLERWRGHWDDLKTRHSLVFESYHKTRDGRLFPVEISANYFEYGGKGYNLSFVRDITERKRAEQEREALIELLRLLNTSDNMHTIIRATTALLSRIADCEAVGVRLRDGEDFPYFETRGFSAEFILTENRLCSLDEHGEVIRDATGNPVLECMCGNILCGRFDPSKPFFTAHGSFWTNSTTGLLRSTTEADRQSRTRNRCNGEGYESVALLPLRAGETTFGLLQLNDPRQGRFTPEKIAMLERFADHLAIGLAQRLAEAEVRELNLELERRVSERTTELEAANKELEAFSYSVSHDLRAPLRHLTGFVNLFTKHASEGLDGKGMHYLEVISDSATQMGRLIDDMLSFSRMGRVALTKTRVSMENLVHEALDMARMDIGDRDIVWSVAPLPDVYGSREMLRTVWSNLISNAIKFTERTLHARIEIGHFVEETDQDIFFVRDNGAGFDMAYADKLFGLFQRLHRMDEFPGTGVGLANVQRIIKRHGGRTWAEGTVGEGATFYFSLPNSVARSMTLEP